jgi:hypothetical protein
MFYEVNQVKWSNSGSERQRSHVFSHMWKTDTSIVIYTYKYAEHISKSGTVREMKGGWKEEKNGGEWMMLEEQHPV